MTGAMKCDSASGRGSHIAPVLVKGSVVFGSGEFRVEEQRLAYRQRDPNRE